MSQAGNISFTSGPIPPQIATSFVTDSGTAVPVANILNVLGNDSTANNDNGISTTGSGNTVTAVLSNRITGSASITGAITGDIMTFSLGASAAVYRFNVYIAGRDTAGASVGSGVGYTIDASAKTDGATAAIISTPDIDADEDAALSNALMSFVASGNTVIARGTGVAGETISYKAVATYVVV